MSTPEEMDAAAADAENDLSLNYPYSATIQEISEWWNKWFIKAGHKRLGRIIVQIARENNVKGGESEESE